MAVATPAPLEGKQFEDAERAAGADEVSLVLYLNSDRVAEATDDEGLLLEGGVGMFGELITASGEVRFDNFEVAVRRE